MLLYTTCDDGCNKLEIVRVSLIIAFINLFFFSLPFLEEYKSNIFYYLMDVLSTVSQFITRTSYIGTNIVMMVSRVIYPYFIFLYIAYLFIF